MSPLKTLQMGKPGQGNFGFFAVVIKALDLHAAPAVQAVLSAFIRALQLYNGPQRRSLTACRRASWGRAPLAW